MQTVLTYKKFAAKNPVWLKDAGIKMQAPKDAGTKKWHPTTLQGSEYGNQSFLSGKHYDMASKC